MRVSHSKLSTFLSCPRKYALRYKLNLEPIETAGALFLGKLVHRGIELQSSEEALAEQSEIIDDKTETLKIMAEAMIDVYLDIYKDEKIISKEEEIFFKITATDELHAIADEIIVRDGKKYIVDFKTSSVNQDPQNYLTPVFP